MYGVAGERRLSEWEVPWLPGYEGSRPVRVGNAAAGQLQLDIYGEVMDALYQTRHGRARPATRPGRCSAALLGHLEESGRSPTTASGRCAARGATSPTPR